MDYATVKALHIIFVVSWFAGLFYMVRLFIYHTEANERPETEARVLKAQFTIMERKLWFIITTPAMVLTLVFGIWMIVLLPGLLEAKWLHVKLSFVLLLLVYHFWCHTMMNKLQSDKLQWTSTQLRLWNELATLLLVIIVFVVVLKDGLNWWKGTLGFFAVGVALMLAVKVYKKMRGK